MSEVIRTTGYTEAKVIEGLASMARHAGSSRQASCEVDVPARTLVDWKRRYPEHYSEQAKKLSRIVEASIAANSRELAAKLAEAEHLALEKTVEKLRNDQDKVPSQTLQRLVISRGISIDKALVLEGRPTQITASADQVQEDLRFLRSRAIDAKVIDAQVIEETTDELPPAA